MLNIVHNFTVISVKFSQVFMSIFTSIEQSLRQRHKVLMCDRRQERRKQPTESSDNLVNYEIN